MSEAIEQQVEELEAELNRLRRAGKGSSVPARNIQRQIDDLLDPEPEA